MRRTPSARNLRSAGGRPPLPAARAHACVVPRFTTHEANSLAVGLERHPMAASALAPLMFTFEDEPAPPTPPLDPAAAADIARVALLAAPATPYEVNLAAAAADAAPAAPSAAALAAALARRGYAASVRAVSGGGAGTACFNNLKHEHVVVAAPGKSAAIVVDAAFRDALAVVSPPPALAALIASLPSVWTGTLDRLEAVVRLVADRTRAALAADGRPTPPWRTASALLSKWRPVAAPSAPISSASSSTSDDGIFDGAASPCGPLPHPRGGVKGASPGVSQLSAALAAGRAAVDVALAKAGPAVRTVRWSTAG